MIDGELSAVGTEEQAQPPIQEARLARAQANEAVQRIQQRIERLVLLSGDNDGREEELSPAQRKFAEVRIAAPGSFSK